MIGANQKKKKKASISEEDISLILQRYTATTILALLQEVAQFTGVKIDWNALVSKTSTGISNAREYQMLWRHLAYHDTLLEKLEDGAEPVDDDSDLEFELEPFPAVNAEASTEAAACVKRWAIIRKKKPNLKPSNASKSVGPTLSEAQLAARQAVSMALNMPMMGSLSSASAVGIGASQSSTPSNASTVPAATAEASTAPVPPSEASTASPVSSSMPAVHQPQQASNPATLPRGTSNPAPKSRPAGSKKQSFPIKHSTGPNPIVQAAAVAAGARIANPITAATLFRAAQSKTAVHIRHGVSVPASSLPGVTNPLASGHMGPRPANIHYIRTGLASPPAVYSTKAQGVPRPAGQHIQGSSGRLALTGPPPPTGPTAPSNRPAQQVGMESKPASHKFIGPLVKAEMKIPSISTVSGGPPSAEDKKPDRSLLVLKEPKQEPVVITYSNAGENHATANCANENPFAVSIQTSVLNPTAAEKPISPPNSDMGENQTAVNNRAGKNQIAIENTASSPSTQASENQIAVGKDRETQTAVEKQTDLPNAEACKNHIPANESVENQSVGENQASLSNADASGNPTIVGEVVVKKETGD
ncbi:uncharacterized protein LOC131218680 isoform X2 [Magnolia sinica]|uniref:uncharacterized protein LOC131218680 isoform X2 n=1 Tax=Magnolia sinica TaxID=86752 RepID=UPI002657ED3D|nr:uncharacterized protein LOC131218680 isoform X2 [Magnolia sinica]